MSAPTLIQYAELAWSTNEGGASTSSVSWESGDVIVVVGGSEDSSAALAAPTATGLTFSAVTGALCNASSDCYANAWVATAGGSGASAVATTGAGSLRACGLSVWVWRGSGGIGNVGASGAAANSNLTQSLVRSGDNSCVTGGLFDWGAVASTGYGWTPAVADDRQHAQVNISGLRYSVYIADWGDQGSAGTASYGITGVSGAGPFARVFIEILGTAGGGTITVTPGQAAETGTAQPVTAGTATLATAGQAAETDAAQPAGRAKAYLVQMARRLTGGTPGAPTAVTSVTADAAATVSFLAPADEGTSTVTQYVITPYISGSAQSPATVAAGDLGSITGSDGNTYLQAAVTGLSNSVAYTFTVAAANSSGTGSESAASGENTPLSGLVFGDDFNGAAGGPIDPEWWVYTRCGYLAQSEVQYYLPDNCTLDGSGNLQLTAEHSSYTGAKYASAGGGSVTQPWRSGACQSNTRTYTPTSGNTMTFEVAWQTPADAGDGFWPGSVAGRPGLPGCVEDRSAAVRVGWHR